MGLFILLKKPNIQNNVDLYTYYVVTVSERIDKCVFLKITIACSKFEQPSCGEIHVEFQKNIVKNGSNKYKYVQNSKPYLIRGWPGVWEEAGGTSRRGVIRKVSVGRRGRAGPPRTLRHL